MTRSLAVTLGLQNLALQLATPPRRAKRPQWPRAWLYPLSVENDYAKAIGAEMQPFFKIVDEEIQRYGNWARIDIRMDAFAADWDNSLQRLRAYQRSTYEENEGRGMYTMVTRFSEVTATYNKAQWAKYLTSLAGQQYFPPPTETEPEVTTRWADANFELIRSLSDEYIKKVNTVVVDAVSQGVRYTDLVKSIQKLNTNISKPRAKLIARDQIGKLNGELASKRQKDAGVDSYIWKSADDERVRSTHRHMDEKTCLWKDATKYKLGDKWVPRTGSMPSGIPGHEIQCRCYAQPNMDEIWDEVEKIAKEEGWYDTKKGRPTKEPPAVVPPPEVVVTKPVVPEVVVPPVVVPPVAVVKPAPAVALKPVPAVVVPPVVVPPVVVPPVVAPVVVPRPVAIAVAPVIVPKPVVTAAQKPLAINNEDSARAFKEAPDYIAKAVAKAERKFKGELAPVVDSRAYYATELYKIHMGAGYKKGSPMYDSVWRHEMGHHLDHCLPRPSGVQFGSKKVFKLQKEYAEIKKAKPRQADNKSLDMLAADVGFRSRAEAVEFVRARGIMPLEANKFVDSLLYGDRYAVLKAFPRSHAIDKEWLQFADMAAALTQGEHGYGHTKEYYARYAMPETEMFAQFTALLSGPNKTTWNGVLRAMFPNSHAAYVKAVTEYGGA